MLLTTFKILDLFLEFKEFRHPPHANTHSPKAMISCVFANRKAQIKRPYLIFFPF